MQRWRNLFLNFFLLKRTVGYTKDYVQILYRTYLGHDKIIHIRRGFPVYSLSTPALYSKPMANFMVRSFLKGIQNRNMPNLVSFAVNDECNAVCEHCSFFKGVHNPKKKVLNLDQAKSIISQAQELGACVINIVGGEPLMRDDLPELISSIDSNLSTVTMFTNGWLLEEKIEKLATAGLDSVYVSLDSSKPAVHDSFRGRKGLFAKAVLGINKAASLGLSTGISATLTPESYASGELQRMIKLAEKLKVHELLIFDAMPSGRYKNRRDLVDNHDWVERMIQDIKDYNLSNPNGPGVISFAYFTSHRSVGCSCGTSYCYISPYGELMSCDFNHQSYGSILKTPLYKLWDQLTSQPLYSKSKWGGCKIKDSDSRKCISCESN